MAARQSHLLAVDWLHAASAAVIISHVEGVYMRLLRILVTLMVILPSGAGSEEYFGRFLSDLSGTFIDEDEGRPQFKLSAPFAFEDPNGFLWEVPADTVVDGASIPEFLWGIAAPFSGDYLWASVVHDYYCDMKTRTAHDTHRSFYYGMMAKKVERWKADAMYVGVDMFGPQWLLETASAAPDLNDPVVNAAARSKMAGIVRTLQWSGGKYFDVTEAGPILTSVENLETQGTFYRTALKEGVFLTDPSSMGVVSFWNDRINNTSLAKNFEPLKAVPYQAWLASGTPPDGSSIVVLGADDPEATAETWLAIDKMANFVN